MLSDKFYIQSALSRTVSFWQDFSVKVGVKFTKKWGKTGNKKRQTEQLKESFYKKKRFDTVQALRASEIQHYD